MNGLTSEDLHFKRLTWYRGFVYDRRNLSERRRRGPHLQAMSRTEMENDLSVKVNWSHVFAIENIIAYHTVLLQP